MKRRDFVKASAALFLLEGCLKPFSSSENDHYLGDFVFYSPRNQIWVYNPKKDIASDIRIPAEFHPHSIERSFHDPNLICSSEKWAKRIMTVDLKQKKMLNMVTAPEGLQFLGHQAFSPDGKYIYATMSADYSNNFQGFIGTYETDTLKEVNRVATNGHSPHQFKYMKGHGQLFIMNAGVTANEEFIEQGNIAIYDIKSAKIIENIPMPEKVATAHLDGDGENFYCIGKRFHNNSKSKSMGAVFAYNSKTGPVLLPTHEKQKEITESFLSAATSYKHNVLGITSYQENMVYFYDIKELKPIGALELQVPKPLSCSLDQDKFFVGSDGAGVFEIDVKTLKVTKRIDSFGKISFGSHSQVFQALKG